MSVLSDVSFEILVDSSDSSLLSGIFVHAFELFPQVHFDSLEVYYGKHEVQLTWVLPEE